MVGVEVLAVGVAGRHFNARGEYGMRQSNPLICRGFFRTVWMGLVLLTCVLKGGIAYGAEGYRVQWRVLGSGSAELTVYIEAYTLNPWDRRGVWQELHMIGAPLTNVHGAPELPFLPLSLACESTAGVRVVPLSQVVDTVSNVRIVPSAGARIRGSEEVTREEGTLYRHLFPLRDYFLSTPYFAGSMQGQVLHLYPFRYNGAQSTLYVARCMVFRVEGLSEAFLQNVALRESAFLSVSSTLQSTTRSSVVREDKAEGNRLLIVTREQYLPTLKRFMHWKRLRGLSVDVVLFKDQKAGYESVQDTTTLKRYLRNHYNQYPDFRYLLLVGSRLEVPPLRRHGAIKKYLSDSDQAWGQLVGNDAYNEVYVGRFSCYDTVQLSTQVDRTIYYERDIDNTANWLSHALLIASNEGGGNEGDNGESDREHASLIRILLLRKGYVQVDTLYDQPPGQPQVQAREVVQVLNEGCGVVGYQGHGFVDGWKTSRFYVPEVGMLQNTGKYPYILNTACKVGRMEEKTPCFAEAMLWARNNRNEITGCVGLIGSSDDQWWNPPMHAQDEMFRYLLHARTPYVFTLGAVTTLGMARMLDKYSVDPSNSYRLNPEGVETSNTWNLFGDPSLVLRTQRPLSIEARVPQVILLNSKELRIECKREGLEARLAIHKRYNGAVHYVQGEYTAGEYLFSLEDIVEGDCIEVLLWGVNMDAFYQPEIPVLDTETSGVVLRNITMKNSHGTPLHSLTVGKPFSLVGDLCVQTPLKVDDKVEVVVTSYPDKLLKEERVDCTPWLKNKQQGECVDAQELFSSLMVSQPVEGDVSVIVTLLYNDKIVYEQVQSCSVQWSQLYMGDLRVEELTPTSEGILFSGEKVVLHWTMHNKGNMASTDGQVYWEWIDSEGTPLSAPKVMLVAKLDGGISRKEGEELTIPSGLSDSVLGLRIRLREQGQVIQEEVLPVVLGKGSATYKASRMNYLLGYNGERRVVRYLFTPSDLQAMLKTKDGEVPIDHVVFSLLGLRDNRMPLEKGVVRVYFQQPDRIDFTKWTPSDCEKAVERGELATSVVEDCELILGFSAMWVDVTKPLLFTLSLDNMQWNSPYGLFVQDNANLLQAYKATEGKKDWVPLSVAASPILRIEKAQQVTQYVRIIDTEGKPVVGAKVLFNDQILYSGSEGLVELSALGGSYVLTVDSKYHELAHFPIQLGRRNSVGGETLQVTRVGARSFSLWVVNEYSRPVNGLLVRIGTQQYVGLGRGLYTFTLPVGEYRVQVGMPGYDSVHFMIDVVKDTALNVRYLVLHRSESLETVTHREYAEEGISVSPNPFAGVLYLKSARMHIEYALYSVLGVPFCKGEVQPGMVERIATEGLSRGVYLLEVRSTELSGQRRVYRLVKE